MKLIFTAANNIKYAQRAMRAGFLYGARLPARVHFPPYFVDQEYTDPSREAYMRALAEHRPALATVLDLEAHVDFDEVLSWANQAAQYVQEAVIIIPKIHGVIAHLPRQIAGKEVRLGYSVLSEHGQTEVMYQEFCGWPVHLLGGDPIRQLALAKLLDVRSADVNKMIRLSKRAQVWQAHPVARAKNKRWPQLAEIGFGHVRDESCYLAAEMSCMNYMAAKINDDWSGQLPLF